MFYSILKATPYTITNRIKCHTKIQTIQGLLFSTMKTFVINKGVSQIF